MVAMRLCVDRLITRHGPQRVALASGLLAASGYLLCAVSSALPVALAGFVLMGMGYAAVIPLAFSRAAADPEIPAGPGHRLGCDAGLRRDADGATGDRLHR